MANPVQIWESKAQEALAQANELINRLPALVNLYAANNLEATIAATPDGEAVAGGNMPKERVLELVGTFDQFSVWLNTPIAEGGPTPLTVASRVD